MALFHCVVKDCGRDSSQPGNPESHFFRIPSAMKLGGSTGPVCPVRQLRRNQWLDAINNKLTGARTERVCARHFLSRKPASLYEKNHLDWVPKLYIRDGATRPTLEEYLEMLALSGPEVTKSFQTTVQYSDAAAAVNSIIAEEDRRTSSNADSTTDIRAEANPSVADVNEADKVTISNTPAVKKGPLGNMVRDRRGRIWLTNEQGKVVKEKDGVILIVDPRKMTVTARVIPASF